MKGTRFQERQDWTTLRPSDWMEMTPSDWLGMARSAWVSMTPSEWMGRMVPGWNRSVADWMNMTPSDWLAMMSPPGMRQGAWPPVWEGQRHRHPAGCECEDCVSDYRQKRRPDHPGSCRRCGSGSCECYCCMGDVDLAIYSHTGEQRVIPLVVENDRHRETQISLELSPWTTLGGSPAPVETVRLEPQTFTLPACGEIRVTLGVRIAEVKRGEGQPGEGAPAGEAANTGDIEARRQLPDVDDCLVAAADLRLAGCDHRPLRIAVAILPHSCDPYRVSCGCACC